MSSHRSRSFSSRGRNARLNSRSRCTVPTIRSRGTSCTPRSTTLQQVEPLAHLVEREEIGGALQQVRQEVLHQRDPPGIVESVHGRDPAARTRRGR